MLICSCNLIRRRDIRRAVEELLADDPFHVLTPGSMFRRLGCRPRCAGCFPMIVALVHEEAERLQEESADRAAPCAAADKASLKAQQDAAPDVEVHPDAKARKAG